MPRSLTDFRRVRARSKRYADDSRLPDRGTWEVVRDQVIADFGQLWPDYESLTLFELSLASCLLTLTQPDGTFPKGATVWKA